MIIISGCSQNDSVFSRKIENNPGSLAFGNPVGFLWTTGVDTTLDIEINVVAAGGLKLSNISGTIQTSDPFTFKGGSYPGTGGTCGTELDSGDTCTLILEYSPTNLETHSATIKMSFSDILGQKTSSYTINADSRPILSFEYGTTYNFGNKFIGSSTDLKIRVLNIGRVAAETITINNMNAPFSFKGGAYPGTGGNCGTRLMPGQTCDIYVNYSPTTNGQHLQDIVLNYVNATKPESNTLSLTAWGFREATLTIAADSDDFGEVASGVAHQKIYTVTHASGDVSANLLTISGLNSPFSRVGGTCGSVLSIDQKTCTIIIVLNSASGGTWSSPMNFSYFNGLQTKTITKTITGKTMLRPVLSITPTTFNFGTIALGSSRTEMFTVQYVSGDLPASSISLTHSNGAFTRNGGTCGTSLSSGSCTIGVRFMPSGNSISPSSSIFSYNDTISTDTRSVSLIGNGPAFLYSSAVNFGTVLPTETKSLDVTVSNTNSTSAINISAGALPSKFRYDGNGNYPGNTYANACGTTLGANSSCRLRIIFDPQASGSFSGSLRINYNNGVLDTSYNISLSGIGTDVADLTISDKDFGTVSVNSYTTVSPLISVSNSSDMAATSITVISMPEGFYFRGGTFPGTGGSCLTSLGKTSCNLDMYFAPTIAKSYSGSLTLRYYNGSSFDTTSATLSGVAVNTSELFIDNFHVVNFGTVNNAQPVKQMTVKVSHGGSSNPATISSKSPLSGEFYIVNDSCPATLVNGESCNVVLGFKPASSGIKTSTFQVVYTAESASKTTSRNLTGNGVLVSSINSTATNFGNVNYGTPKNLTVTLSKSGDFTITSLSAAVTGSGFGFLGGSYPGTGGNCSTTLITSCNLVLTYNPSGSGAQTGNLRLNFNNGYQLATPIDLTLTANVISVSNLSFMATTYDFGKVIQTQKAEKTVTLRNTGNITANFTAPTLTAPFNFKGSYPGTGGTCSNSLSANQTCTMVIEFSPTSTGIKNQNLTINYDNGSTTTTATTAFTGEGLAQAIIAISESNPYNFGTTNVNGTISKTFTLTNSGSVNGTGLNGVFTSAFNFLGGSFPGTGGTCMTTLNAGQSCTIVLSFTPIVPQVYTGTFTLNYNDGLNSQTELKNLSGTGSNSLNYSFFLAQLEPKETSDYQFNLLPAIKIEDMNKDGLNEWLEPALGQENDSKYFYYFIDGQASDNILVRIYNLFPSGIVEGISAIPLAQDYNNDGYNDLLIGIYQKNFMSYYLKGYDILSGKDGNVIERYLPISYQ